MDAGLRVLAQGLDERAAVDRDVNDLDRGDARSRDLLHHRRGDRVVPAGDHRLRLGVDEVVLHHHHPKVALGVAAARGQVLELVEQFHQLSVAAVAERPQERRRVELPAAAALVHEAPHHVVGVEHDLDPVAAVRDDAHRQERLAVRVDLLLRRDAGAAVELRDHHALGAVDHERAVGRHDRHVAEEHLLLAHVLALHQAERHLERADVGLAVGKRLEIALLLRLQVVRHEVELVAAVEGDHREDLLEDRLETLVAALLRRHVRLQELAVRLELDVEGIGHRRLHAVEPAEHFAFCAHVAYLVLLWLWFRSFLHPEQAPEVW